MKTTSPDRLETLIHIFRGSRWRLRRLFETLGVPRTDWLLLAWEYDLPTTDPNDEKWDPFIDRLSATLDGSQTYRGSSVEQEVLLNRAKSDPAHVLERVRELKLERHLRGEIYEGSDFLDTIVNACEHWDGEGYWLPKSAVGKATLASLKLDCESENDFCARAIVPNQHLCGTFAGTRLTTLVAQRGIELGLDRVDLDQLIDATRSRICLANHGIIDLDADEQVFFARKDVIDRLGLVDGML